MIGRHLILYLSNFNHFSFFSFLSFRLFEIGPRLKLQLVKIEEGLMTGEVMFHEFIKRTPEEIRALKERIKNQKLVLSLN